MNFHALLLEREAAGRPVTVGLIGAGKFGTMFLAQVRRTRGMHLVGIADLSAERAKKALASCGWDEQPYQAASLGDAFKSGRTHVTRGFRRADRVPRHRGDRRGDRRSQGRHPPRTEDHRARQACRDGQRRGRRGGGAAACLEGARRGRDLQPRLGRSTGADLRACRLGARGAASRSSRPARARAITRPSINRRRTPCGTISGCRPRSSPRAA